MCNNDHIPFINLWRPVSEIVPVRKVMLVVSRQNPGLGGSELVEQRVQHSEDPNWESSIWRVENPAPSFARTLEAPARLGQDLSAGRVRHQASGRRYEIVALAYCLDAPPSVNNHRAVVFYRALSRSPHGRLWIRPIWGRGGWLTAVGDNERFAREAEHLVA